MATKNRAVAVGTKMENEPFKRYPYKKENSRMRAKAKGYKSYNEYLNDMLDLAERGEDRLAEYIREQDSRIERTLEALIRSTRRVEAATLGHVKVLADQIAQASKSSAADDPNRIFMEVLGKGRALSKAMDESSSKAKD